MKHLINQIKKSVVFLGYKEKNIAVPFATGFLIKASGITHLVTAKHVYDKSRDIKEEGDYDLYAFFNLVNGDLAKRNITEMIDTYQIHWIYTEDKADIALIPFGINVETDDLMTIPENLFLLDEDLCELYDIFYPSYQPSTFSDNKVKPILRNGIISRINNDGSFFIDGASFPGNSGSPVFLTPSFIRYSEDRVLVGEDPVGGKLVGVISEYITNEEYAISSRTKRLLMIIENNIGVSIVSSVKNIVKLYDNETFQTQTNRLRTSNTFTC